MGVKARHIAHRCSSSQTLTTRFSKDSHAPAFRLSCVARVAGYLRVFFTLGAIQRQIETGAFYKHDVISSASGSTIVCALIERCYDLGYVDRSSEWFTAHVVRPLHRLVGDQTLSGVWLERVVRSMVDMALVPQGTDDLLRLFDNALFSGGSPSLPRPKSSRPSNTRVKKPRFLCNYVDFNTGFVTTVMSDIRVDDALKYVKIMARCVLPYNPRRLTLITIKNVYQYGNMRPIHRFHACRFSYSGHSSRWTPREIFRRC